MTQWSRTTPEAAAAVVVGLACVYFAVIAATRIAGLRSLAKMSSFDLAMTVAIGTLVASTALSGDTPIVHGLIAVAALYLLQWTVARLRYRYRRFARWIDNTPLLLVEDGRVLEENLRRERVTRAELRAAVRAARLHSLADVRVAVLETTGDISIIPGPQPADPELLEGVRRS